MSTATGTPRQRLWLLVAVPTSLLGLALAALLAHPNGPPPSTALRLLAQCCGVLVLGLAAVDRLEDPGKRQALRGRVRQPVAVIAGAWTLLEVALAAAMTAEATDQRYLEVPLNDLGHFLGSVPSGRVSVLVVAAALAAMILALREGTRQQDWPATSIVAVAAVALIARPLTGHLAQSPLGAVVTAAHALSAALWCGLLAALALTTQARGVWARVLPRFSAVALRCVAVLTVSGVLDALIRLDGPLALFDTGYGRILLAKTLVLIGVLALAWHYRRGWVRDAGGHRSTAQLSLRRAIVEVALVAIAFGLAAALATTG